MYDLEMQPTPLDNGSEPMTFELRRLPFWSPFLGLFVGITGVFAVYCAGLVLQGVRVGAATEFIEQSFVGFLVCALLLAGVLGYRTLVRSRPMPPIAFYDDHVELPSFEALGVTRVAYRDILSTGVRGRAPTSDLLVETRRNVYVFPLAAFRDQSDLERTAAEVTRRLIELPEGQELVEQAERRRLLAAQALTIRPLVTQALAGILVVVYLNQLLTSGRGELFDGLRWGASVPALIWSGEAFRLVSATFLHGFLLHIALNALALYVLGSLVERFLGWQRFLLVYFASGLAGSLASALVGKVLMSLGASGAIFGLLGGLGVLNFRYRAELPLGFRQPHRWWVMVLGISVALPLLPVLLPVVPFRIDFAAHAGGFVAGVLLTLGLVPRRVPARLAGPVNPAISAAALGLAALFLLGMVQAVRYAANFDDAKRREALSILVSSDSLNAQTCNRIAWTMVTDPEAGDEDLRIVERAARRAVKLDPGEVAFRDTLATVAYRLGRPDEAVELERAVIETPGDTTRLGRWLRSMRTEQDLFMPSQLARFLMARLADGGPKLVGGVGADAVALSLDIEQDAQQVVLDATRAPVGGFVVYAVVTRDDERLGLVRAEVGAQPPAESRFDMTGKATESIAGPRVDVRVALIDATPAATAPAGRVRWKFWPNDPGVDRLP